MLNLMERLKHVCSNVFFLIYFVDSENNDDITQDGLKPVFHIERLSD